MRPRARGRTRSPEREVRLGGESREADARQVAPALVDHVPRLPPGKELAVELGEVVELEPALEAAKGCGLEPLRGRQRRLRREERRERREVQRDALVAHDARPRDRLAD